MSLCTQKMKSPIKAVFVTNIPAPYRERVHELVAENATIAYTVIYCSALEPNRQWKFLLGNYPKIFLGGRTIPIRGQFIYLGTDILQHLRRIKPDVVITGGFSIPMLLAFAWAKLHGARHVALSDSHPEHESHLSFVHRILRKIVYRYSHAFLGASIKTRSLFECYKKNGINFSQTHLCADNKNYASHYLPLEARTHDLMYCGRICKEKKSAFFAEVVSTIQIGRPLRVLIVGDGPERQDLLTTLERSGAIVTYAGFLDQASLPAYYASARILLFPTERDAWGIVANEAMAVGTPVITCPEAGVADELIIDNISGYVRSLHLESWVDSCEKLLTNTEHWKQISQASVLAVASYSHENAAAGIISSVVGVAHQII